VARVANQLKNFKIKDKAHKCSSRDLLATWPLHATGGESMSMAVAASKSTLSYAGKSPSLLDLAYVIW